MEQIIVPPAEGRAVRVAAGQKLKIVSPHGSQAADFFAYNAGDLDEWLSPMHTWVWTRSVRPRLGDVFLSRFRNPMAELAEDGAGGVHDMMIAARMDLICVVSSCPFDLPVEGWTINALAAPPNCFWKSHDPLPPHRPGGTGAGRRVWLEGMAAAPVRPAYLLSRAHL